MALLDQNTAFAHWVRTEIEAGLTLPESVHGYMAATFGSTDLATIIGEDETGELDSLLELIFYPDMNTQMRFESQWGDHKFTKNDLPAIQSLLCQSSLSAAISQSTGAAPVTMEVPAFVLNAFVQRLNITWQLAGKLKNTLEAQWQGPLAIRMQVHLRNARIDWHTNQVQLVNQFLAQMPPDAEDAEICINFLLTLLTEYAPKSNPFEFLIAKKFFYFQSLCKAENFERRRNASNMEIMMLQGNLAAHGNVAQWRQQMQWIDRICYTLYGRTHFFQQPDEQSVDLQTGNGEYMIDKVIRTLS